MSQWDEINPSAIFHIAQDIRDGGADPDDARRLLEHFCDCVDNNAPVPHDLARHLSDSFKDYLKQEKTLKQKKTLESSLGLKRKPGRPEVDEDTRMRMAAAILEKRMDGQSHQDALMDVAEQFGWSQTIISMFWRRYKLHAIDMIRAGRPHDRFPSTADEKDRLCEILGNGRWFSASEKP